MIGYASRTGTVRNARALNAAGWRWLVSPHGKIGPIRDGMRFALDNGAWTSHEQGRPFDARRFEHALGLFGLAADWIVVPDIVMGGRDSLDFSRRWLPRMRARFPTQRLLIAVQDGMTPCDLPEISPTTGIFVGGSTDWKLGTMQSWATFARSRGAYIHVGRVNTARRIAICAAAAVDSFDGSGVSRFIDTLPGLDGARRQPDMLASLQ